MPFCWSAVRGSITVDGQTYDIGEYVEAPNLYGLCTAVNETGAIYLPLRAVTKAYGGRLEQNQ